MDINSIMYGSAWQEAALNLVRDGYELKEVNDGIIPAIFTKGDGNDLYLYMPDAPKMASRAWASRPITKRPLVFGVKEAAEHLGCSTATIKHAVYNDKSNPLVPDQRIGDRGGLIFIEETLVAWHKRRPGAGAPPGDNYLGFDRLWASGKEVVLVIIKRMISTGRADINRLTAYVLDNSNDPNLDRERLNFQIRFNLDGFIARLSQFTRQELIELIAEDIPAAQAGSVEDSPQTGSVEEGAK